MARKPNLVVRGLGGEGVSGQSQKAKFGGLEGCGKAEKPNLRALDGMVLDVGSLHRCVGCGVRFRVELLGVVCGS